MHSYAAYGYGVLAAGSIPGSDYDWGWLKRSDLKEATLPSDVHHGGELRAFQAQSNGVGVCRGDSGGPLIRDPDSNAQVVGLVIGRVIRQNGRNDSILEATQARVFAFSNYNKCGVEGDEVWYVATRLDDPTVQSWVASVVSGEVDCSFTGDQGVSLSESDTYYLPVEPLPQTANE